MREWNYKLSEIKKQLISKNFFTCDVLGALRFKSVFGRKKGGEFLINFIFISFSHKKKCFMALAAALFFFHSCDEFQTAS